ncbi:hypothetical protein OG985_04460 [Streptomyces sp. NBC_00289]|uniref:hypothetical protein n=1 Tax=Streptomyces sp. NBC_00289 TaxID=2975703 RepID=UPI00324D09BA
MHTAKETSHEAHRAVVDAVIAGDARAQTVLGPHLESVAAWIEKHRVRRRGPRIAGNVVEPDWSRERGPSSPRWSPPGSTTTSPLVGAPGVQDVRV